MRKRIAGHLLITVALVLAAGCSTNDPASVDSGDVESAEAPSLADIRTAVSLDETEAAIVGAALGEWQRTATARRASDGHRIGHHTERPSMQFLARTAPTLDNKQLSDLVGFLVAHREQARKKERSSGSRPWKGHAQRFAEELGLNERQVAALKAQRTDYHEAKRRLRDRLHGGDIDREAYEAGREKLRAQRREELAAILTKEQLAAMEAKREAWREQAGERGSERIGQRIEAHVEWLTKVIELDAGQAAEARAVLESSSAKRRAAFESLRDGTDRADVHAAMREIQGATEERLGNILSADQAERFEILNQLTRHGPRRS
jgi:hypothetical protein